MNDYNFNSGLPIGIDPLARAMASQGGGGGGGGTPIYVDDVKVQRLDLYSATLTLYEVGSITPVSYKIYAEEE